MTAEGDIPLDMELRGSMDVVVDGGTHNGFVNLRLTSGVIDWQAEEIFGARIATAWPERSPR